MMSQYSCLMRLVTIHEFGWRYGMLKPKNAPPPPPTHTHKNKIIIDIDPSSAQTECVVFRLPIVFISPLAGNKCT